MLQMRNEVKLISAALWTSFEGAKNVIWRCYAPCVIRFISVTEIVALTWRDVMYVKKHLVTNSKLRPVVAGYSRDNLSFLSGPIMNT